MSGKSPPLPKSFVGFSTVDLGKAQGFLRFFDSLQQQAAQISITFRALSSGCVFTSENYHFEQSHPRDA